MSNSGRITDALAKAKILAFELLAKLKLHESLHSSDLWQLHENKESPPAFAEERRLLDQIIALVIGVNGDMVSPRLILDRILYQVIGVIIDNPGLEPEILPELEKRFTELLTYEARRPIDVPVAHLDLEGTGYRLGVVDFLPVTDEDRKDTWWDRIAGTIGAKTALNSVVSYARVVAQGDLDTSLTYAAQAAEDALLLLRGICFPFSLSQLVQIGIVGSTSLSETNHYRPGKPNENAELEFHPRWVARLGPGLRSYRLHTELLSTVDAKNLENLRAVINQHGFNPQSTMPAKLMAGIRWIGEASKPDRPSARFAKLTFALENLVGGDPTGQTLSSGGLTDMLAERTAFLVAGKYEKRRTIDASVRRFYGIRSAIVHGRVAEIRDEDLRGFAVLVRQVVWALLQKLDQIKSVNDLAAWIKEQRYS